MKRIRFHLSTLLLLSIFAGAMLGVAMDRSVWRLEHTITSNTDSMFGSAERDSNYSWLSNAGWEGKSMADGAPELKEGAEWQDKEGGIIVFYRGSIRVSTLPAHDPITMLFSPSYTHFAVWFQDRIEIYRRMRPYGWRGSLTLPLFWTGCAALLTWIALTIKTAMRKGKL